MFTKNNLNHLITQEKGLSHIAETCKTIVLQVDETTACDVKSLLVFFIQQLYKNTQNSVYFRMCDYPRIVLN